jgi:anti-anti-sigma regulatory factor
MRDDLDFSYILAYWRAHEEAFITRLIAESRKMPNYADLPQEALFQTCQRKTHQWQRLFESGDLSEVFETTEKVAHVRAAAHFPLRIMMASGDTFRDCILWLFQECYAGQAWPAALVGQIDARRASQVADTALSRIVESQADVLILDITGVSMIDTQVASYLLQIAKAVTLLGAQVVLVGISAEIAQTVVQLGINLGSFAVRANLQDGIAYALDQLGYAIMQRKPNQR